jgi:hypothetical protein
MKTLNQILRSPGACSDVRRRYWGKRISRETLEFACKAHRKRGKYGAWYVRTSPGNDVRWLLWHLECETGQRLGRLRRELENVWSARSCVDLVMPHYKRIVDEMRKV